jgi:chaperonin GroEL (HSP60 family)
VKKEGKSLKETQMIKGIIVDKEVVHEGMPKKLKNAKIALLNAAMEIEKTEIDAEIRIKTPDGVKAYLDQETEMLKKMVDRLSLGRNVLPAKRIDDVAQHFSPRQDYGPPPKESDMEKLAGAQHALSTTSRTRQGDPGPAALPRRGRFERQDDLRRGV